MIVLVVAIFMALLAGSAVVSFLNPHRSTIYIFKSSYPIGTQITSDMLSPLQVDSSIVSAGATQGIGTDFVTASDIRSILESGDSLKISVSQGIPLMKSLLSISGGNSIMMSMKPSSVAVTVSVDNTTGITKDLYSGASVNVYVTSYSGGTFLLFENMRVLEITRKNNGELSTVTLEVSNEEAVKLINSTKNGAIHLGLINPNGYVYEEGTSDILVNPDAQQLNEEEEDEEEELEPVRVDLENTGEPGAEDTAEEERGEASDIIFPDLP